MSPYGASQLLGVGVIVDCPCFHHVKFIHKIITLGNDAYLQTPSLQYISVAPPQNEQIFKLTSFEFS
jgi:hypothetical protein